MADEKRWAAVMKRDAREDGTFVFAVVTTGIYCRPSCPARRPRRTNVRFFATTAAAETAGFRACKRCKPTGTPSAEAGHVDAVARACRMIDEAEEVPALAELAAAAGFSASHFHRLFTRIVGVTPRDYARAARQRRLRSVLPESQSVTEAIYDAGYVSTGRFYEEAETALGMNPSEFRAGGAGTVMRFAVGESSLGAVLVAATDKGISAILLGDDAAALVQDLQDRFPKADLRGGEPTFEQLVARVIGLIEQPRQVPDLPLDVRGTVFQHRVWRALTRIPAGQTVSYAELAHRIGAPSAVRAVARACGANPVAVAIPCHRVVRTDGDLSGYRWGVERKQALLARERGG